MIKSFGSVILPPNLARMSSSDTGAMADQDPSAQIHAPFDRLTEAEMRNKVDDFIQETNLSLYHQHFLKGAFLNQNDEAFKHTRDDDLSLSDEESTSLLEEKTRRWKHPRAQWELVILCAIGAATQGWDESAVDGGEAPAPAHLRH